MNMNNIFICKRNVISIEIHKHPPQRHRRHPIRNNTKHRDGTTHITCVSFCIFFVCSPSIVRRYILSTVLRFICFRYFLCREPRFNRILPTLNRFQPLAYRVYRLFLSIARLLMLRGLFIFSYGTFWLTLFHSYVQECRTL